MTTAHDTAHNGSGAAAPASNTAENSARIQQTHDHGSREFAPNSAEFDDVDAPADPAVTAFSAAYFRDRFFTVDEEREAQAPTNFYRDRLGVAFGADDAILPRLSAPVYGAHAVESLPHGVPVGPLVDICGAAIERRGHTAPHLARDSRARFVQVDAATEAMHLRLCSATRVRLKPAVVERLREMVDDMASFGGFTARIDARGLEMLLAMYDKVVAATAPASGAL